MEHAGGQTDERRHMTNYNMSRLERMCDMIHIDYIIIYLKRLRNMIFNLGIGRDLVHNSYFKVFRFDTS